MSSTDSKEYSDIILINRMKKQKIMNEIKIYKQVILIIFTLRIVLILSLFVLGFVEIIEYINKS